MNEKRMKEALDTIARRNVPDTVNLWQRIETAVTFGLSTKEKERRSFMQILRTKPALMLLVVLLVVSLLTGVAYAIGRSLGYIPGFGLVEQGTPIRVLKAPVSVTRQGVTVTVKSAILTADRTSIEYSITGVPPSAYPEGEAVTGGCIGELSQPYLLLPNGTKVPEGRFLTTGIPADVDTAVFVLPCIFNTLPGTVPENWELSLQFVPAQSQQLTVFPVTEIPPSPQPSPSITAQNPLALTRVLDIGNRFVLMGEFRYDVLGTVVHDNVFADGSWLWTKNVRVMDASGREIPLQINGDIEGPIPSGHAEAWMYQIDKNFIPPLTIYYEVERVTPIGDEQRAEFEFDAGTDPQEGMTWPVNREFTFGGYRIHLNSITLEHGGYNFHFKNDPDASANLLDVEIVGHPPFCGGGGGGPSLEEQELTRSVCYGMATPIPTGKLQIVIKFQALRRETQIYQLKWEPPQPYATATPQPGVCLTLEAWNRLADDNEENPLGVGGKIVATVNEGGMLPAIYVSNLDGTILQKVDSGAWASLSPDGMKLAFSASDGIRILDLSSGQTIAIGSDGYRIIWSPDGSRMMFTATFALNVVNADGSGLRQIDTVPAQVISPVGWLPDNQTIVYGALDGGQFMLMKHNLQNGETKALFPIQNKAGYGAISPDGGWIVFADRIVGESNWGIFISRLDGSERKLVVEPQVPTAFMSVWSPDGQWLIINTRGTDNHDRPVLVNPFTCQVVPLKKITGTVEGWGR